MNTHLPPRWPILVIFFLALYLLFFHRLIGRDLWSSHEARAAMDGQTVLDDDWVLPHLYDGQPEFQKPPLYYWLVAAIAQCRGGTVDAWAVRLPATLSALACVLLVAGLGWWRGRPWLGLVAATVLATTIHFTWLARIGRIDMPLTLCVSTAVLAFHLARPGETKRQWLLLLGGYLALAAGILLKGPIGLVLPAAVVGVQRLVEGAVPPPWRVRAWGRLVHELGLWWGLPLVLVLSLPWFILVNLRTAGEEFQVFFWYHNVARGLGGGGLRAHPVWWYFLFLFGDYLPWTPLLPVAAWLWWRKGWGRGDADVRLGLIWFGTMFVILSLAQFKRSDYLLPAIPGAALFLAGVFCRRPPPDTTYWPDPVPALVCLLALPLTVLFWLVRVEHFLPAEESYRDYRAFATEVRSRAPMPSQVLFFRTEAHALAFHTGRPLTVLVQWPELGALAAQPGDHYVVMPQRFPDGDADAAAECLARLPGIQVEEVARNTVTGSHERPLVLLRLSAAKPSREIALHARHSPSATDGQRGP